MEQPSIFPNPAPDFERLRKVVLRQGLPDRVPFVELFADREIMEAVLGCCLPDLDRHDRPAVEKHLDGLVRFNYLMGYDHVTVDAFIDMPKHKLEGYDTAALKRDRRTWDNEATGPIQSWQDFETYPWPKPEDIDYYKLEYVSRILPGGMKMIYLGPGGQFVNLSELLGLTALGYWLVDDPALVQAVAEKVGNLLVSMYSTVVEMPGVGAVWLGDDLGFKTSTLISPRHLRQYIFPWHKKLAQIAHAHNLPFLLHSCGNLSRVMDDLIDVVGIDAKHSYEDVILTVSQAKQLYGSRVALLGGIDMDFLCRATPDQVREYTRRVLEACMPGGGYALGTGNSVANYIPLENYLAMLEVGRDFGRY